MPRTPSRILAAFAVAVLLAVAVFNRAWGAVALLVVGTAGWTWYQMQRARGAAEERFFGDAGEETRLTSFNPGSPSEMPADPGRREAAGKNPRQPH